jgi:hypothetical protein
MSTLSSATGDLVEAETWYLNWCDYLDPGLAWIDVKDSGRAVTLSALGFDALTRPKLFHPRTGSDRAARDRGVRPRRRAVPGHGRRLPGHVRRAARTPAGGPRTRAVRRLRGDAPGIAGGVPRVRDHRLPALGLRPRRVDRGPVLVRPAVARHDHAVHRDLLRPPAPRPCPGRAGRAGTRWWGAGAHRIDLSASTAWMDPCAPTCDLLFMHQDQVVAVSPGGVVLATTAPLPCSPSGPRCSASRPTRSSGRLEALLADRVERVGADKTAAAGQRLATPIEADLMGRWLVRFIEEAAA